MISFYIDSYKFSYQSTMKRYKLFGMTHISSLKSDIKNLTQQNKTYANQTEPKRYVHKEYSVKVKIQKKQKTNCENVKEGRVIILKSKMI